MQAELMTSLDKQKTKDSLAEVKCLLTQPNTFQIWTDSN